MSDGEIHPSLNEVASLAKRAVRGAGMSWGIAEEAASSVRWLSHHNLPGPALLAALLDRQDNLDSASLSPQVDEDPWVSVGEHVCPLLTAAAFSDRATVWQNPGYASLEVVGLAYPLLLLPAVAQVSTRLGVWLHVCWDDVVVRTDGQIACIEGAFETLTKSCTDRFQCTRASGMMTLGHTDKRQAVDRRSWSQLEAYAHRTYAPATEESRRLGAGTDLSDNT